MTSTPTGFAELTGTWRHPILELSFSPFTRHPTAPKLTMLEWVQALPGRQYNKETSKWTATGIGPNPDAVMANAGFEVIFPTNNPELGPVTSLQQLYAPVTMLAQNRRTVLMRHRFAGYDEALKMAGAAAVWEKKQGIFRVPVADVLIGGQVRPGIIWDSAAIERAAEVHTFNPAVPGLEHAARILGSAVTSADVPQQIAEVEAALGTRGADYGVNLFGYQEAGHLAVAAGHRGLFDAPGAGKTTQFIAAAKVMRSERTLIICPPLVLTNWQREVIMAGLATESEIAVFRTGRKEPELAGKTVVIIADSLVASRPETATRIAAWGPTVMGYDEAHRAKTIGSKRGEAILDLVAAAPGVKCVAITGTPMFAGPHELIPLLDLTGHLVPVFGGPAAFLARYCRQDHFGGWHARKEYLGELRQALVEHVWVRRTKEQVLPDLPPKSQHQRLLDVDLALYRKAHKDVMEKVTEWLEAFQEKHGRLPLREVTRPGESEPVDEIREYASESIRFVSMLRRAAGLTKVAGAVEDIQNFVESTTEFDAQGNPVYTRPLIVWTHHNDVTQAMAAAIPASLGETGVIMGGTSDKEKNRVVDAFQAGKIPVLVCSITAAGVGITLTRSSDVLFVETDWTPALIAQAIDRAYRIGQTRPVVATTLVALGTLDEHIQKVLLKKAAILGEAMGDGNADMAVTDSAADDLMSATDIMELLIEEAIQKVARKR